MPVDPSSYRRPPFRNRPWITGKLYDDLARKSILHVDAWVMESGPLKYFVIDYREAGKERVALDAYLIEQDGTTPVWELTPVWDTARAALSGVPLTWSARNHAMFAPLHARLLAEVGKAMSAGRWARASVLAHYVNVREIDVEIADNHYTARKPYAPRNYKSKLPDAL